MGAGRARAAATWCRRSGCPIRACARSASGRASGCTWSGTARRSSTASTPTLITFGKPCPVSDLFGAAGRQLLATTRRARAVARQRRGAVELIDELERQIAESDRRLRRPRRPPLRAAADDRPRDRLGARLHDRRRDRRHRALPHRRSKLTGYTGLCPRVYQSGDKDRRGPLTKHGPTYLRWALVEATTHACSHPAYRERYQRTKQRLGNQRGAKVAQVDIARRLAEAIWHMLTRNQPFAPQAPAPWPPDRPFGDAPRANVQFRLILPPRRR